MDPLTAYVFTCTRLNCSSSAVMDTELSSQRGEGVREGGGGEKREDEEGTHVSCTGQLQLLMYVSRHFVCGLSYQL